MTKPPPAVALTRLAVRHALRRTTAGRLPRGGHHVVVGVSGGADSRALAAALAFEAPKQDVDVWVLVVDHGLQEGSDQVAQGVRENLCGPTGFAGDRVAVRRVEVAPDDGRGLEAAARAARYAALFEHADAVGAQHVWVAHTGDDQAEQVLLGLLRGSGTRSLAGMRPERGRLVRPFLLGADVVPGGPVMREHTVGACDVLGIPTWHDPHNDDGRFARVRARRVLRRLEGDLAAPNLRRNLVRTATSAARDADLLDRLTDEALVRASGTSNPDEWPARWPVEGLTALDPALRIRALRRLLVQHGASDGELAAHHLADVERLLIGWRGQGPIDVPGSVEVTRSDGELVIGPRRILPGAGVHDVGPRHPRPDEPR